MPGTVVLFQPDSVAQETEGRLGIATDHAPGDVQTDNSGGAGLRTQAEQNNLEN
jgi:hypothetical protein